MKLTNNLLSQQTTYSQQKQKNDVSFGGIGQKLGNAATAGLQACNKYPMIGVAFIDLASTIVPRTIIDAQTNGFAAAETFRRESSGLVVNCLIPSFLVMGAAKLVQGSIMGKALAKVKLSNMWLDENNVKMMSEKWTESAKATEGKTKQEQVHHFVENTFKDFTALDGREWKPIIDLKDPSRKEGSQRIIDGISNLIVSKKDRKEIDKELGKIYTDAADQLKATKNLKWGKESFSSDLSALLRDTVDMGRHLNEGKLKPIHSSKLIKLINTKSILGMAAVSILAVSMQPINRFITQKRSGQKGAPIYKDFADQKTQVEMTAKDKAKLNFDKLLSIGAMIGTSVLSMKAGGVTPNMQMFQFKGKFPTVNQCRVVATETNASRMAAAEDKNELRETTFRDIVCFSSLYFLGDYVSKGVATILEKTRGVKLLNHLEDAPAKLKGGASFGAKAKRNLKVFTNWVSKTKVKDFDELPKAAHNLRSACELSSLGFSIAVLGVILPKVLRLKTNKERAKELAQAGETQSQIQKYYPLNMTGLTKESKQVFAKFVS